MEIKSTNHQNRSASVIIDWHGHHEIFKINHDETPGTFNARLALSVPRLPDDYLNEAGFYTFAIGTPSDTHKNKYTILSLAYIGKVYDRMVRGIMQKEGNEALYNCIISKGIAYHLYLSFGTIVKNPFDIKSPDLIDDIHCCLVKRNNPTCNNAGNEVYTPEPKRSIQIMNTGAYFPLKEFSDCE